jgi:hypothetical protein
MEEEARKLDLRPLLVVAGVVAVVLTMWAAGAFAAGGSSSPNERSTPSFIQNEEDAQPRTREDCPEGRGGGRGGQGPSDGNGQPEGNPDGSGSPSL